MYVPRDIVERHVDVILNIFFGHGLCSSEIGADDFGNDWSRLTRSDGIIILSITKSGVGRVAASSVCAGIFYQLEPQCTIVS